MNNLKITTRAVLFLLIITSLASLLSAEPTGPYSINESVGETRGTNSPYELQADAGNVTALYIDGTTVTKSWQGYYGNISGTIVLDDNGNYSMFDWSLASPQGEIYASNGSSITWAKIKCINYTANMTLENINLSIIESMFGMNSWDPDGVNETFNATYTDATGFYVGNVQINNDDGCPLT